ncbi:MAG TPA: ABC transporter ATP-binding protein [Cyanobacteria bacterium UBA8530]|nr:ABC transporter ATP-binding protein [Cyanobacteria bacterium UBA8530]
MKKKYWLRLLPLCKDHLLEALLAIFCLVISAASSLAMVPLARFISEAFGSLTLEKLNLAVSLAILAYFLKYLFAYSQNLLIANISLQVVAKLRSRLFGQILSLSLDFHRNQRAGEVASRLVSDVSLVRDALAFGFELFPNGAILIGAIAYLFVINWRLALFSLIGIPLVGFAINQFGSRIRGASHQIQGKIADILAYIQEIISGVLVVKGFGQEKAEQARFDLINDRHFLATFRGAQIQALQNPAIATIQIVAFAGVIWFAGWEILHARLSTPDLFAFGAAMGVAIDPTLAISNAWGKFQLASAALVRVYEFLDAVPSVQEKKDALSPESSQGSLVFDKVSFSYPEGERKVLENLDFSLPPGKMLALVGPSGGGKTTFANLLLRFYDPSEGRILLDGFDLKDLSLDWLRCQIGYVPQDNLLFRTSVFENIRYGKPEATLEEVIAAAKAANADEFIENLPQKYDSLLEERATNLSGGQKQRLAIARALLRNPKILILDEATSALDNESETWVQESLERLMRGRTVIVIAHRLSTIRNADRIGIIQDGRLSELSSYEELLALYPKMEKNLESGLIR